MEFLTHTNCCPNCGSFIELGVDDDYAYMNRENTVNGVSTILYIPVNCSCGWSATEKWWLSFIEYEDVTEGEAPVNMHEMKSSVIHSIGFDTTDKILYVKFHRSEKVYSYPNVKPHLFIEFLDTDHPGRFYNNYIRGQ